MCLVAQSLFVTPWTVAYQALLSMGTLQARILEWPSPGDLPIPGVESRVVGRFFSLRALREAQTIPR